MSDYNVTTSPIFGEIEYFESHEDLSEYLEEIKPTLANIIIEFNSLEDEISTFLCEMANDAEHEKIYVFLADMMFRKKSDALVKMYLKAKKILITMTKKLVNWQRCLVNVGKVAINTRMVVGCMHRQSKEFQLK